VVIRQGEIYWVNLPPPRGSEPGFRHPHVIVQNDVFNDSELRTVVTCVITSNLQRAIQPGNVALAAGEGNLPKRSVVNVTQIITIDRSQLRQKVGMLSKRRVQQIIEGMGIVLEPA
jgi:mRNA interferase MazF